MNIFLDAERRLRATWRFLLAAVVFVAANFAAAGGAMPVGKLWGRLAFESLYRPLLMLLLVLAYAVMLKWLDRVPHGRLRAQGLGFDRPWLRETLVGTLLGIAMVAAAVAGIAVFADVQFSLHSDQGLRLLVFIWMLLPAAMAEEVAFRGYPFQRLVEAGGPWVAIGILSAFFGLVHLGNPNVSTFSTINTIAIGVVLSLAYLRTGALWLPFGIHFGWNFALGELFGLPVSGISMATVVEGNAQGADWITGGAYGPEASAVGSAVIVVGLFAVLWLTRHLPPGDTPTQAAIPGNEIPAAGIQSQEQP